MSDNPTHPTINQMPKQKQPPHWKDYLATLDFGRESVGQCWAAATALLRSGGTETDCVKLFRAEIQAACERTGRELDEALKKWADGIFHEACKEHRKFIKKRPKRKVVKEPTLDMKDIVPDDDFGRYVQAIIDNTEAVDSPVCALGEALAGVATVMDASYGFGARMLLNHYGANVGKTFCGKSSTRSASIYLLSRAGVNTEHLQRNIGTYEGLENLYMNDVSSRPVVLYNPDEIGFILRGLKNNNNQSSFAKFVLSSVGMERAIMEGRVIVGKDSGDGTWCAMAPNFILMGGTTIEELKHGTVTKRDVHNGMLNRLLMLNCEHHVKAKYDVECDTLDTDVIERLSHIWQKGVVTPEKRLTEYTRILMTPETVEYDRTARTRVVDDKVDNLEGRKPLLTRRIAAFRAAFNSPDEPNITIEIYRWAERIVEHSIAFTRWLFHAHLSDDRLAELELSLIRIIRDKGTFDSAMGIWYMRKEDALSSAGWKSSIDSTARIRMLEALNKEGTVTARNRRMPSGQAMAVLEVPE